MEKNPGLPTAHAGVYLPLLPSGSDGVHRSALHWSQLLRNP